MPEEPTRRRQAAPWAEVGPHSPPAPRLLTGREILGVIGVFVAIVALLLTLCFASIQIISWVRAYVEGESLWSKAQKEAVLSLHRYAQSGEEADYQAYLRAIAVPLGDRQAMRELEKPTPDLDVVYEGFLQGGNHPEDLPGMVAAFSLLRRFNHIDRAITTWMQGDSLITKVHVIAEDLHREVHSGTLDVEKRREMLRKLDGVDTKLTSLETAFSRTLGEGTRWMRRVMVIVVLVASVLLMTAAALWAWFMIRRIRNSQQALRNSEEQYRSLVERAAHGIYRSTAEGKLLAVNPAFVDMLGYRSEEEMLALSLEHDLYLYPDDRARLIRQYAGAEQIEGVEVEWRRRDGTPITVRLSGRPVHDAAGKLLGFEMIAEDVTERKALEEQLRQSQKMEAVGQLTGGIAHDLNNLLTVILANADLLATSQDGAEWDREADAELAELREAARRGAALIRKLLAFSRREKLTLGPTNIALVVHETSRVLRRLLPESIAIEVNTTESVPSVQGDAGAVEQVIVNLATNARDAMPSGGRLRIEVRPGDIDPRFAARRGWGRPGQYVCLRVTDTGCGMDEETRKRVFEPFFTTKPPHLGTGLGMAMIYGLVKQHDGYIDVESQLGDGTRVTIYFPVVGARGAALARAPLVGALPGGHETILVVEDEEAIRNAVRRGLERLGYTVLLAGDGEEGLRVFREHHAAVDLVLSDVVMPKRSGPALYRTLRRERPDLKVMFMSGYTLRDVQNGSELEPDVPLLRKPWTLDQLAGMIRQQLDQDVTLPTVPASPQPS